MVIPENNRYHEQIKLAESLGWEVDLSRIDSVGPMFKKGNTVIWKFGRLNVNKHVGDSENVPGYFIKWQVADIIDGRYCNHRPCNTLEEALTKEDV